MKSDFLETRWGARLLVAVAAIAAMPAQSAPDGAAVYATICSRCHSTGEYGSPKLGDAVAWTPRFHEGVDHLVEQAINGLGAMPPRGGVEDLSDADLRAAIVYMLGQAGLKAE